jgi:hypothetical protein
MLSLPLTEEGRQAEWQTIQDTTLNNIFPTKFIAWLKIKMQYKTLIRAAKDENEK